MSQVSDTRPPLDVEALARALGPVLFAHTPFRPDAQEGDYGGMVNIAMHNDTLARERIACQRAAEKVAAAYQPTGPDDLAGLEAALENDIRELRGSNPGELAERLIRRGWRRGVTLTGVRSSEDTRRVVETCPDCGRSDEHAAPCTAAHRVRLASHPPRGVRSSEVDGLDPGRLAEAMAAYYGDNISTGYQYAVEARGIAAQYAALTGDTGPEMRYSCPDEPPTSETRHLYCPGCLSYFGDTGPKVEPEATQGEPA